jgi:hypothetical protein
MSGIMHFVVFVALFNIWITIIITAFSYIIPLNENTNHQSNHFTPVEPNKKLIYQESWVLKLECLQCHERFERWSKNLVNNHSMNVIFKEKYEGREKEKKVNGKENVDTLWVKEKSNDDEREKMNEWIRERMEDNEWSREWMNGIVG